MIKVHGRIYGMSKEDPNSFRMFWKNVLRSCIVWQFIMTDV